MGLDVSIYEVCLRDGLQNEPVTISTDDKVRVLEGLVAAGFRDIEVTSFVSPRWVPQLVDASEVVARAPKVSDVRYWTLVPNNVGLVRAVEAGVRYVATFLSASESHNLKNVNRTVKESLSGLERVIGDAVSEDITVRSYISTVFGCPYEGDVSVSRTIELAHALMEAGATTIALGDTTGMGHPEQVRDVLTRVVDSGIPMDKIALHFHDTRGTALANIYAAWQLGARAFDGSISGVGGCPYAPGAAGNACTQDVVHLFERMELNTGVNLDTAGEVGRVLENILGRPLPGRYHQYWLGREQRKKARSA